MAIEENTAQGRNNEYNLRALRDLGWRYTFEKATCERPWWMTREEEPGQNLADSHSGRQRKKCRQSGKKTRKSGSPFAGRLGVITLTKMGE